MLNLQFIIIAVIVALLGGWGLLKSVQVRREQEKNEALTQKNEQLKTAKAVAETKVKNYQVRQKNEERINATSHDGVIDRLHADGDLRD